MVVVAPVLFSVRTPAVNANRTEREHNRGSTSTSLKRGREPWGGREHCEQEHAENKTPFCHNPSTFDFVFQHVLFAHARATCIHTARSISKILAGKLESYRWFRGQNILMRRRQTESQRR